MSETIATDVLSVAMAQSLDEAQDTALRSDHEGCVDALKRLASAFEQVREAGHVLLVKLYAPTLYQLLEREDRHGVWQTFLEENPFYDDAGNPILICLPESSQSSREGSGFGCRVIPVRRYVGIGMYREGKLIDEPLFVYPGEIEAIECIEEGTFDTASE